MNRRKLTLVVAVVIGVLVIVGAVVGYIVALLGSSPEPSVSPWGAATAVPSASPSASGTASGGAVVDAGASALGLVPEPITQDIDVYAASALRMPWTYDTTKVTLDQFKDAIRPWFSGDPVDADPAVRDQAKKGSTLALFQADFFPTYQTWESFTSTKARSVAEVVSPITYEPVAHDVTGNMRRATAQVKITVTQDDGGATPAVMESIVEAKAAILCDKATEPVPNSAQQPGDCKLISFIPALTVVGAGGDD